MTTTSAYINAAVDAAITLIKTNATTSLGCSASTDVYERDEHPAVFNQSGRNESIYIIPIVEGGDTMDHTMGLEAVYHSFPITFVGLYRLQTDNREGLESNLRTIRNYGYKMFDLILINSDQNLGGAESAPKSTLDTKYWQIGDNVIYAWILKCDFRMLFCPAST